MKNSILLLFAPLMTVAPAAAQVPDRPAPARGDDVTVAADPVGQVVSVRSEGAPPLTLRFKPDGVVTGSVAGREAQGRWSLAAAQLCLTFPGQEQECWPHASPFVLGDTVALTSASGSTAEVTRLE